MADADDSAVGVAQILLEPRRRFEIEVIGRFVEQQDFGRRGELTRQRHAPAFTTTQRTDTGGLGGFRIKADAHQHGIDLGGHLIAAVAFKALEVAAVLFHRLFAVIMLEIGRLRGQRCLERAQIAEGVGHDLPERHAVGKAAVLVHERHAEPRHARDGPTRGGQVAGNQADQRGFARAVPADHGPAVAGRDGQGNVAKDLGRAEIHPRVPDRDKGHACACRRCAKTVICESNGSRSITLLSPRSHRTHIALTGPLATHGAGPPPRVRSRSGAPPASGAPATRARVRASRRARPRPHRPPRGAASRTAAARRQ